MSEKQIKVLMIEDNPGDARLIREVLNEDSSAQVKLEHVTRLDAALARLAEGETDVILLDLFLPDSQGIDTFNRVHGHSPEVPIVVLSGLDDEAVVAETLRSGGQDYLNKGILDFCVLHRSIQHAIGRNRPREDERRGDVGALGVDVTSDQLLGVLARALRAPLARVLSAVSALSNDQALTADHLPALAMIQRHLEEEARVVDDLLAYSRVGTRLAATFQPTDCEAVLERAVADLKPLIEESAAVVTHDPLPTLMADAVEMQQSFQHLIAAAMRYRGDAPLRIHVAAVHDDKQCVLSFQVNRAGFDPALADRIFTPFQRLHAGDDYPGTGLALAICKKIVEHHGGRIWAESAPGRGFRFCVAFLVNAGCYR
jgi:signal transduction histidine kinase